MAAGDALIASASASRPSAHTQRYDRQLRLWASSGQASLESAKILVLGASHVGACVLKNLILPGIGSFTLVDGNEISHYDVGNNFFIGSDTKGKKRATEVVKNLCELNPSVKGQAIDQSPLSFVKEDSLQQYTLIIAINQPESVLTIVSSKAWEAHGGSGIPLMVIRGAGFVGEVQVQVKETSVIETHPETIVDLRLARPWPALQNYANEYKIDGIDSMEHSHIPYIVILLRKLQEWKQNNGGALPIPSKDRKSFTDSINQFRQANNADAENVDEALEALGQHVWRPISAGEEGKVPSAVQSLFKDDACDQISQKTTNFWLMVRALRSFVKQGDGTLPLPGSLPDMKALSATYVELQRLYRQKASEDLATFKVFLAEVLAEAHLPQDAISPEEIESFAKHASFLKLIRGKTLQEVQDRPNIDTINAAFADELNPNVYPQHFALLASEEFYKTHNSRYPGSSTSMAEHINGGRYESNITQESTFATAADETTKSASSIAVSSSLAPPAFDMEADLSDLLIIARDLSIKMKIPDWELVEEACREITRSGHADLPSTAALLGGIAAQEAIKIVTRQYIPINNTVVYDGIKQAMAVFPL